MIKVVKRITTNNKEFSTDKSFILACATAGIEPTTRQASKYRREKGLAFKTLHSKKERGLQKK